MIHEVDESLRQFVRRDAIPGNDVDVVFDAPTKDWASRRNSPSVDLYLYDIREDLRRRHYGEIEERGDDGLVSARRMPPRWFKLSYLVTAWTQRPEDEHRLLSIVLACFMRRDSLPKELLAGSLAGLGATISYTCALPPPQDRALSDVWSALGGELKPSLDLVLVAPIDLSREVEIAPAVDRPLGIDMTDGFARDEPRLDRGPTRPDGGERAPSATEVAARSSAGGGKGAGAKRGLALGGAKPKSGGSRTSN